jgi:GT2 family glycosyltransferase
MCQNVLNQLYETIGFDTEVIIIDNGSDVPFHYTGSKNIIRNEKSIGVYPTFKQGFEVATGDVVAFFHSDLVVWEKDWDKRVIKHFQQDANLGMIGFIGSNEIDWHGGRGLGTTSNFKGLSMIDQTGSNNGKDVKVWVGSHGAIHGKVNEGYTDAVVVDGCAMIIRRTAWQDIGVREDFPPHHFYDRLISTQLIENGWNIGVLGIACDHFSGQTVNIEPSYQQMAYDWLSTRLLELDKFNPEHNYDHDIYKLAEQYWLCEYRDKKHIVPIKL